MLLCSFTSGALRLLEFLASHRVLLCCGFASLSAKLSTCLCFFDPWC